MAIEHSSVELGAIRKAREAQQLTDATFKTALLSVSALCVGIFVAKSRSLVSQKLRARSESHQKPPQQ